MRFADIMIKLTYTRIDEAHMLVHMYNPKFINNWMLLDLDKLAHESGKSIDEVIERLTKKEVQ